MRLPAVRTTGCTGFGGGNAILFSRYDTCLSQDPFSYDPNDLPLALMQYQFNERLLQTAAAVASPEDDEYAVGLSLPVDTVQSLTRLRQASDNLRRLDAALDM